MQIENLNEETLKALETFVGELKAEHPEITSKVYKMPVEDLVEPRGLVELIARLDRLEESLAELKRTIHLIFADYVLIDGRFVSRMHQAVYAPQVITDRKL